jgi:hypothetical protein
MDVLHEQMKKMTPEMFAHLGQNDMVYIKPVRHEGTDAFAVHAANGQELAILESWEAALTAALQNDMKPARLH